MLVNILTEGKIPMMDIKGPIFGYDMSDASYQMYVRYFPQIKIERTSRENAINKKREYLASKVKKEPIILHDSVEPIKDTVLVKKVKTSVEDDEIDKILGETVEEKESSFDIMAEAAKVRANIIYKDEDLVGLTKKQLGKILIERGYTPSSKKFEPSSPFAPKYHDTVQSLIEKIKKTQ